MNEQTIKFIEAQYPHGIPARLIRMPIAEGDRNAQAVFSGPSAARLAIVFREENSGEQGSVNSSGAMSLVTKAIIQGLKLQLADVLLVMGSSNAASVSLGNCSPRVVLNAGDLLISDSGKAQIISTDSVAKVLVDPEAKKRFWQALKSAWEASQK